MRIRKCYETSVVRPWETELPMMSKLNFESLGLVGFDSDPVVLFLLM
jgi:hypothetical protein